MVLKKERAQKARAMQFFLQNIQKYFFKILKMFKCKVKFTRRASGINSKTPHSRYSYFVTIVGHCFSVNI